ncbi:hypothetical protein AAFF_G00120590 [Aldrovandia affinis]|uniref:Uncharacterized protein n=1 Tax=Aldrovandia affinis TaxID=143900 RepID=A0AAD7W9Y6_9TELE|nr:hypothetical protein AAFF_G00120590 [Aldrovandia affinis]
MFDYAVDRRIKKKKKRKVASDSAVLTECGRSFHTEGSEKEYEKQFLVDTVQSPSPRPLPRRVPSGDPPERYAEAFCGSRPGADLHGDPPAASDLRSRQRGGARSDGQDSPNATLIKRLRFHSPGRRLNEIRWPRQDRAGSDICCCAGRLIPSPSLEHRSLFPVCQREGGERDRCRGRMRGRSTECPFHAGPRVNAGGPLMRPRSRESGREYNEERCGALRLTSPRVRFKRAPRAEERYGVVKVVTYASLNHRTLRFPSVLSGTDTESNATSQTGSRANESTSKRFSLYTETIESEHKATGKEGAQDDRFRLSSEAKPFYTFFLHRFIRTFQDTSAAKNDRERTGVRRELSRAVMIEHSGFAAEPPFSLTDKGPERGTALGTLTD